MKKTESQGGGGNNIGKSDVIKKMETQSAGATPNESKLENLEKALEQLMQDDDKPIPPPQGRSNGTTKGPKQGKKNPELVDPEDGRIILRRNVMPGS